MLLKVLKSRLVRIEASPDGYGLPDRPAGRLDGAKEAGARRHGGLAPPPTSGIWTDEGKTMTEEDYARLARLLEEAAQADQRLAMRSSDPVQRYQARVNADLFTAARNAASEHREAIGDG